MSDYLKFQANSIFAEADKQSDLNKQREYYVVKHNDIIQNQTFQVSKKNVGSMTATEQKIFLYIISKIKPTETDSRDIKFDIQTFCKVVGIGNKGNNYINLNFIFYEKNLLNSCSNVGEYRCVCRTQPLCLCFVVATLCR